MITIKQLRYALAIAQTLHFKKAAELCHISQSTLSSALNELETSIGETIFERDNKKVLITPSGELILEKARQIIEGVTELEAFAAPQQAPLSYPLTLGMIPTIAPYLLPELLPHLNKQYPKAQLTVLEEQSHRLVDLVKRGELDAAILALPYDCEGLLCLPFWEEIFYWVTLKDEIKRSVKRISSQEIDQSRLMLLHEGHCLKDHILDACRFIHHGSHNHYSATSLTTLVHMVAGGLGTTFIPKMALKTLTAQHKALVALPLSERGPHRTLAFIIRPNYTRLSTIEAMMQL